MALTNEASVELGNVEASPPVANPVHAWHGRVRIARFDFTQGAAAGDAGSSARLIRLPAGRVRVLLALSRIAFSAMGTARTMDLGWEAYTDDNGTAVAAAAAGLDAAVNVAAAGSVNPSGTVGGDETVLFASESGVVIAATINGGTIPAAATLKGYLLYVVD